MIPIDEFHKGIRLTFLAGMCFKTAGKAILMMSNYGDGPVMMFVTLVPHVNMEGPDGVTTTIHLGSDSPWSDLPLEVSRFTSEKWDRAETEARVLCAAVGPRYAGFRDLRSVKESIVEYGPTSRCIQPMFSKFIDAIGDRFRTHSGEARDMARGELNDFLGPRLSVLTDDDIAHCLKELRKARL